MENKLDIKIFQKNLSLLNDNFLSLPFFDNNKIPDCDFLFQKPDKYNIRSENKNIYSDNILLEIEKVKNIDLKDIDILFIYGIGLGYHYLELKKILDQKKLKKIIDQKKVRKIIFLEDDKNVFLSFLYQKIATDILQDSRCDVFYLLDSDILISSLAYKYALEKPEVFAIDSYKEKENFKNIKDLIFSYFGCAHAIFLDRYYNSIVFNNFINNAKKIKNNFFANNLKNSFKNIPAIVLGAGPSLEKNISLIKTLKNKAIIIAAGSAKTASSFLGLNPHISMGVDPNFEEYLRLKPSYALESIFIYTSRVNKDVFKAFNGLFGYLKSDSFTDGEDLLHKELNLKKEHVYATENGMSITTLALPFAAYMGCNPIILSGVDLSYKDNKRYSSGVTENCDMELDENKNPFSRFIALDDDLITRMDWKIEAKSLASFAKNNPNITFINTSDGLTIENFAKMNFENLLKNYLNKQIDINALINCDVQQAFFDKNAEDIIIKFHKKIENSLNACKKFTDKIIEEFFLEKYLTPKARVFKLEMQEELAYKQFFRNSLEMIEKRLEKIMLTQKDLEEGKWKLFGQKIQEFLNVFE